MPQTDPHQVSQTTSYDVVIVGASLAGCAAAIQLGRSGARVAVVEKKPDADAFKRICSHFIQASAVPTLERMGLLESIEAAGATRPRVRIWSRWGWIQAPPERAARGVNLRRELLDPLVRSTAAETPGVELMLGWEAERLLRDGDAFGGVAVRNPKGEARQIRARLTIGADGRDSRIAELSGVPTKTYPNNRFAYGGYFKGGAPAHAPDATAWFMDPQWAAAFPTDHELTFYAAMPTKDRLPEFKRDPEGALVDYIANVPEPPPIREGRLVGPVLGKVDMTNRMRRPTVPGLALIGDAAHGIHPIAGQGLNLGFKDVAALAEVVVEADRLGQDIGALDVLEGYERWRRFDTALIAMVTDGMNRLFSNDVAPVRALRDFGLGLVDRAKPIKDIGIERAAGVDHNGPRLLRGLPV